jgi:hypothetical protein
VPSATRSSRIVAKLCQADRLLGEGLTIPQTCKRSGSVTRPSTARAPRYGR